MLHHRPRCGDRQGTLADVEHRAARASPAATPGAICRCSSAPAATCGCRAATIPQTNLVYWGTAQAKPWARAVRGTDGAALYTSSTLALDPDTGKMKWYYQHIPGETQDMDEAFERILVDVDGRKSMFTMGKLGISVADRSRDRRVHPRQRHRIPEHPRRGPRTGKVTYNPGMIPQVGVPLFTDGWTPDRPTSDPEDLVFEVELAASRRDPYRQLSRLFHLVGRHRP